MWLRGYSVADGAAEESGCGGCEWGRVRRQVAGWEDDIGSTDVVWAEQALGVGGIQAGIVERVVECSGGQCMSGSLWSAVSQCGGRWVCGVVGGRRCCYVVFGCHNEAYVCWAYGVRCEAGGK